MLFAEHSESECIQPLKRRAWLCDNEFITDNDLVYVKPAVIRDKQHYERSESTLYRRCDAFFSGRGGKSAMRCEQVKIYVFVAMFC